MGYHYDGDFKLKKLEVGTMENNCYVLIDPDSNDALIIDAAWETERILDEVKGLKVQRILTTHGHFDHHNAFDPVRKALGVPGGKMYGDPTPRNARQMASSFFSLSFLANVSISGRWPSWGCFSPLGVSMIA